MLSTPRLFCIFLTSCLVNKMHVKASVHESAWRRGGGDNNSSPLSDAAEDECRGGAGYFAETGAKSADSSIVCPARSFLPFFSFYCSSQRLIRAFYCKVQQDVQHSNMKQFFEVHKDSAACLPCCLLLSPVLSN